MTTPDLSLRPTNGFSLVEMLAVIAIIGIVIFLAIPNLLQIKSDGEQNLAISRAESLNMGMASFIQAQGQAAAETAWSGAGTNGRYGLVKSYVAFAPAAMSNYMPSGYAVTLPGSLTNLTKATLTGPAGTAIAY